MNSGRTYTELTGCCAVCGTRMARANGGRLRVACEGACTAEWRKRKRARRYYIESRVRVES